ncbi:hypothetical protein BGZ94_010191 [Podila epigama]|nr:hypothetical protein BGZ94_010191 [Podila epigama]
MAFVRSLKRPRPLEITDLELDDALKGHHYGGLVNAQDYRACDENEPIWHMPFRDNGKKLARILAGLLIQSGDTVLYAVKVEVYGRRPSEDGHTQDLAIPTNSAVSIVNNHHDNTSKVVIGTLGWNALEKLNESLVQLNEKLAKVNEQNKSTMTVSRIWNTYAKNAHIMLEGLGSVPPE